MQEQEDNIQFDTMPDFREMFSKQVDPDSTFDEKEYDSLYDELVEKCHPNRFIGVERFDENLFQEANKLYAEILKCKNSSEWELIHLRNIAIEILGVHFSTKKKYEYLNSLLNPGVYTNVNADEYDSERVSEAAKWYAILQENRNDIRALDVLETEASDFIKRREKELFLMEQRETLERTEAEKKEIQSQEEGKKDDQRMAIACLFFTVVGILFAVIANKLN